MACNLSTINLLVVGDSEVRMFYERRQQIKEDYGVRVDTEYRSGATLDECLGQVKRRMKSNTHIIIIWALTPYAWRRTFVRAKGKRETTIFGPRKYFTLDTIPGLMNNIMNYVLQLNSSCEVYLSLPTIKDMYEFNQNRLVKAWGENFRDFLYTHPEYNPECMRRHSINIYYSFWSLYKPQYRWVNKQLLYGNGALNCFIKRRPFAKTLKKDGVAHIEYLSGNSLHLNSELIPDGLHGSQEYLKYYLLNNKKIFEQIRDPLPKKGKILQKQLPKTKGLLGDYPPPQHISQCPPPKLAVYSDPSEKRPPLSSDRVTECFYRFVDLDQPSTSHQGCTENPHTLYNHDGNEYESLPTQQQHTAHYYPYTITNPFLLPSYSYGKPNKESFPRREDKKESFATSAHVAVRAYLGECSVGNKCDKKRKLEALDDIIKAAEYERELVKREKQNK